MRPAPRRAGWQIRVDTATRRRLYGSTRNHCAGGSEASTARPSTSSSTAMTAVGPTHSTAAGRLTHAPPLRVVARLSARRGALARVRQWCCQTRRSGVSRMALSSVGTRSWIGQDSDRFRGIGDGGRPSAGTMGRRQRPGRMGLVGRRVHRESRCAIVAFAGHMHHRPIQINAATAPNPAALPARPSRARPASRRTGGSHRGRVVRDAKPARHESPCRACARGFARTRRRRSRHLGRGPVAHRAASRRRRRRDTRRGVDVACR